EDGIRDFHVTGVQTCALPIFHSQNHWGCAGHTGCEAPRPYATPGLESVRGIRQVGYRALARMAQDTYPRSSALVSVWERHPAARSEERRVGKGWRCSGAPWPQ